MDASQALEILAELKTIQEKDSKSYDIDDLRRVDQLEDEVTKVKREQGQKALQRQLDAMGNVGPIDGQGGNDLASAIIAAGFDRKTNPAVMVDHKLALGVEEKTGSVSGDLTMTVQHHFPAAGLGIDGRYIFPHLNIEPVEPDAVAVATYRQKSRTLATASDMLRAVDAVTTKPTTNSVAEPLSVDLLQVATISAGTPNVLLANDGFRSWVNGDLVAAYRRALDFHIVAAINAAPKSAGATGLNSFEDILSASELVRAAGYEPNLVVMSPHDALAIRLLQFEDGDSYVFPQTLPTIVESTAVSNSEGFVCDSNAIGTLFLSPFTLSAFEENAGATNSSTVRAESNGVMVIQRPLSIASLDGTS